MFSNVDSAQYISRQMPNGEKVEGKWLVYSVSTNSIFCYCCKMFSNIKIALTFKGFNDWGHTSQFLDKHEKSLGHIKAFDDWKELEIRLKTSTTIDDANMRIHEELVNYWRNVLRRIFAVVRFLGVQNLAFLGNSQLLNTPGNETFWRRLNSWLGLTMLQRNTYQDLCPTPLLLLTVTISGKTFKTRSSTSFQIW